jgi:hypothetical protein
MSRTRWLVAATVVLVIVLVVPPVVRYLQASTTPPLSMTEKIGILNKTAQKLNTKDLSKEYCSEHLTEDACSYVSEFAHYHIEPVPETPTNLPYPEPSCGTLCVVSYSDTDVELKTSGPNQITVLVVTVSLHENSADPTPVSLEVIYPSQTAPVSLQYANGLHVGIIIYYSSVTVCP